MDDYFALIKRLSPLSIVDTSRRLVPHINNRSTGGTINTIARGLVARGASLLVRKAYAHATLLEAPISKGQSYGKVISFSNAKSKGIKMSQDDIVVISMTIPNFDVKIFLIDNRSFIDILFYNTFYKMNMPKYHLWKTGSPLVSFSGDAISIEGTITLPMTVG